MEEASRGEGSSQGKGLHLLENSRHGKGRLREMPFCCSGSENMGWEDHSGTEVSGCGSPQGLLTTRHRAGASYPAIPWLWALLPTCAGSSQLAKGCSSSTSPAGPHSHPTITPGSILTPSPSPRTMLFLPGHTFVYPRTGP